MTASVIDVIICLHGILPFKTVYGQILIRICYGDTGEQ